MWCLFKDTSGLCLSAEAWAAWAQAFGAIVAIGAAFLVAHLQLRASQRAARADASERRMQGTLTLTIFCESACRRVESFRQHMSTPSEFLDQDLCAKSLPLIQELRWFVRSVESAPLFEGSHETARLAMAMRMHLQAVIDDATHALTNPRSMDMYQFEMFFANVDWRLGLLRSVLSELERLSDRLHDAAGRPLYEEWLKGRYLADEDTPISAPTPVR